MHDIHTAWGTQHRKGLPERGTEWHFRIGLLRFCGCGQLLTDHQLRRKGSIVRGEGEDGGESDCARWQIDSWGRKGWRGGHHRRRETEGGRVKAESGEIGWRERMVGRENTSVFICIYVSNTNYLRGSFSRSV